MFTILVEEAAAEAGLSRDQTRAFVKALFNALRRNLIRFGGCYLPGLGTLAIHKRQQRVGFYGKGRKMTFHVGSFRIAAKVRRAAKRA